MTGAPYGLPGPPARRSWPERLEAVARFLGFLVVFGTGMFHRWLFPPRTVAELREGPSDFRALLASTVFLFAALPLASSERFRRWSLPAALLGLAWAAGAMPGPPPSPVFRWILVAWSVAVAVDWWVTIGRFPGGGRRARAAVLVVLALCGTATVVLGGIPMARTVLGLDRDEELEVSLVGQRFDPFPAHRLGGPTVESWPMRGIVVVDLWATWCPPCREALPRLAEIATAFRERGVRVIALEVGRGPDDRVVEPFARSPELAGLEILVADEPERVLDATGRHAVPQTLVLRDGVVVDHVVGVPDGYDDRLVRLLARLAGSATPPAMEDDR